MTGSNLQKTLIVQETSPPTEEGELPKGECRCRPWEFLVFVPSLILAAVLAAQRELVFRDGGYGPWNQESLILLIWALLALTLSLASRPWRSVSRWGGFLRWGGVLAATSSLVFLLLVTSAWGRYQILRFEAVRANLRISSLSDTPIRRMASRLTEPATGPYLCQDPEVRRLLLEQASDTLLKAPAAAGAVLLAELAGGANFEQLSKSRSGLRLLLACLTLEANPRPWHGLPWVRGRTPTDNDLSGAALLTTDQARLLVAELLRMQDLSQDEMEALVFVLLNFPQLFELSQTDRLLTSWAKTFDDLEPLAIEGLVLRQRVMALLEGRTEVTMTFEAVGPLPGEYAYRHLRSTLEKMAVGLVGSTGVSIRVVPVGQPAELQVVARLQEIPHHSYRQPTYTYETVYQYRTTGLFGRNRIPHTERVAQQKQVLTGYEDRTSYAPAASITMTLGSIREEFPETLLFWHHFRFDYQSNRFMDLQKESVYGRMWPFGVHQSWFAFPHLDA
jgi:hypothetical protein